MNRLLVLFAAILSLVMTGCPGFWSVVQDPIDVAAANGVADVANASLPMMVELFNQDGYRAIEKAKTKEEATAAIVVVEAKWKPVWQAWHTLKIAHDAWVNVINSDGDTTEVLSALKDAYCGLLDVWPKQIPVVPMGAFSCGEVIGQ